MKQYYLISALAILCLFVTGCGTIPTKKQMDQGEIDSVNGRMANFNSSTDHFLNNSVTSTINDLLVGKKVMVMGVTNSDGTITASQILLGEFTTSSFGFNGNVRPSSTSQFKNQIGETSTLNRGNFNGQRPNATGDAGSGKMRARTTGMTRINGEILKIDSTSLVVKIVDGGSKIVFYTTNTKINTLKVPVISSTSTLIN